MNPIFSKHGNYPQIMIDEIGNKSKAEGRFWSRLPTFTETERKSLIGSADFLGLNYYTSRYVSASTVNSTEISFDGDVNVEYSTDDTWTTSKSSWLFGVPKGLEDLLKFIKNKYSNPTVIITENGFSDDGQLDDVSRIEYLKSHIFSVGKAIKQGCNVVGYTVWSIVDNFEWVKGYTEYFGIFAVNMSSDAKERTPKSSANFIKELIANKTLIY